MAIIHQNEYILQGFKRKEKETAQNYDIIIKDSDQKIQTLQTELEELKEKQQKEESILKATIEE